MPIVDNDDLLRQLRAEIEALKKALEAYTGCRHAEQNCRCTMEARAALYPYLKAEGK